MKKLLLFLIFSGSLDCFCQSTNQVQVWNDKTPIDSSMHTLQVDNNGIIRFDYPIKKQDTLSAYLLVTTKRMGIAYQKLGFIVRRSGKEDIFLDCKKQPILPPYNVWDYRLIPKSERH